MYFKYFLQFKGKDDSPKKNGVWLVTSRNLEPTWNFACRIVVLGLLKLSITARHMTQCTRILDHNFIDRYYRIGHRLASKFLHFAQMSTIFDPCSLPYFTIASSCGQVPNLCALRCICCFRRRLHRGRAEGAGTQRMWGFLSAQYIEYKWHWFKLVTVSRLGPWAASSCCLWFLIFDPGACLSQPRKMLSERSNIHIQVLHNHGLVVRVTEFLPVARFHVNGVLLKTACRGGAAAP